MGRHVQEVFQARHRSLHAVLSPDQRPGAETHPEMDARADIERKAQCDTWASSGQPVLGLTPACRNRWPAYSFPPLEADMTSRKSEFEVDETRRGLIISGTVLTIAAVLPLAGC